ncbi:Gfo/Idh/MocA family protein [Verrucomicrobiota bacterium]
MKRKYTVVVAGIGKRGMHHAAAFHSSDRFEVVGICDIDESRLKEAAADLGDPEQSTDAASLAESLKPDLFCFCTLPGIRAPMLEIGVECGAKLIAFEKPMALSSNEAMAMRRLLTENGVKGVVSHQHRYGAHYRKVKEIVSSGILGRVHTVYASATGWLMHMMTHMVDYMRWYNDEAEAEWVMGQAAGRHKLPDGHPSPDYVGGFIHFANGVHGIVETGAGAPDVPEVAKWWAKNRIGAQGTEGFAEVLTNGGWRAVTRDGFSSGEGAMNYDHDMPLYVRDMADWLDDDAAVHPCNFESAYKGFEITMALCRSAIRGGQVALPLTEGADEMKALGEKVPHEAVRISSPVNAEEYGV